MKETIVIQNLKCSGCEASIIKLLSAFPEVKDVKVHFEDASVHLETVGTTFAIEKYTQALTQAGYPPAGDPNTTGRKVKSYISCAIGRVSKAH